MRLPCACVVCNTEMAESVERWAPDFAIQELRGAIRTQGPYKQETRQACVLLAWSGHTTTLTLCGSCELTPENLPQVWRECIELQALTLNPHARIAMGHKALSEDQYRKIEASLLLISADRPLGVLYVESLQERLQS